MKQRDYEKRQTFVALDTDVLLNNLDPFGIYHTDISIEATRSVVIKLLDNKRLTLVLKYRNESEPEKIVVNTGKEEKVFDMTLGTEYFNITEFNIQVESAPQGVFIRDLRDGHRLSVHVDKPIIKFATDKSFYDMHDRTLKDPRSREIYTVDFNAIDSNAIDSNGETVVAKQSFIAGILNALGMGLISFRNNPNKAQVSQNQERYGGIDLTPANMNLQTQNAGEGIKFHIDPAQLQELQNAPGFMPVILNIQPMTDMRTWLGLNTIANDNVPKSVNDNHPVAILRTG